MLKTANPAATSIPSYKSEGNEELQDISIGSTALTARAVLAKKAGVPNSPGLEI